MPRAAGPRRAQPWSRATRAGVARRGPPDSWPARASGGRARRDGRAEPPRGARATATAAGLPALRGRTPGRGQENNTAAAGPGRRPRPPPAAPRPRAQVI